MTTKVLTGVYMSGYEVEFPTPTLSIASSGFVEGKGVYSPKTATDAYSIINEGGIASTGNAVYLNNGGTVTNGSGSDPGAGITGQSDGVVILFNTYTVSGTVTNYGTISSSNTVAATAGVYLDNGG